MKCNKCKFENNIESRFCINCGNELVSNNPYIQDENINKQKKICKTMGILGVILSIFINILSLPFNIIAVVKGSKLKKQIGKNEIGYFLGIIGIILSIIIFSFQILLVYNFVNETDKLFTKMSTNTNNDTIVEILQDKNIISEDLNLIDIVTEVDAGAIPHRYTYYIYQEDDGNIIAIYYKTNTITKDNFTVKIYDNLNVQENIEYIYGDTGEYGVFYSYRDGSVSETNKYFDTIINDYKTYSIIKKGLGYSVKKED